MTRSAVPPQLDVVIPAYNEAARLPLTLPLLTTKLSELKVSSRVTVVDNGSTDNTASVVRGIGATPVPVRVLTCERRGKGAAVRAGMLAADSLWVGFMDADLATSLDALTPTVAALQRGCPLVIGTRRHDMSRLIVEPEAVRRIGGWAFRAAASSLVPGVKDTQCGYKFFDQQVARRLFREMQSDCWVFDVELLARARLCGLSIAEIPVDWSNQPGSRFRTVVDGANAFWGLAKVHRLLARERAASAVKVLQSEP